MIGHPFSRDGRPPSGLRLIGLTGGIGSGKSLAARLIAEAGIPVIDADSVAREVVEPGTPGNAEIAAAWPEVIAPDGSVDRRKLGQIVFRDSAARKRLESITHPRIVRRSLERSEELARQGHRLAFYEAALLVETGRHKQLDGLVVVTAPEDVRIRRVMQRDGVSEQQVRARIQTQLTDSDRLPAATHILVNDGDEDTLRGRIQHMLSSLGQSSLGQSSSA